MSSWYLRFENGYDVPCMSVSFSCLLLFVSLFLALVRCLAVDKANVAKHDFRCALGFDSRYLFWICFWS
jgi:hypothetical protein